MLGRLGGFWQRSLVCTLTGSPPSVGSHLVDTELRGDLGRCCPRARTRLGVRLGSLPQLAREFPTALLLSIPRQLCTQLYQLPASWHRSLLFARRGHGPHLASRSM